MNSLTSSIWLRRVAYTVSIIGAIGFCVSFSWDYKMPMTTTRALHVLCMMMAFFGLMFGLIMSMQIAFRKGEIQYQEEGWKLTRIVVQFPNQPEISFTENITDNLVNNSIYNRVMRYLARGAYSNDAKTQIQVPSLSDPVVYVFEKPSSSSAVT